jgi:hypothetical protein
MQLGRMARSAIGSDRVGNQPGETKRSRGHMCRVSVTMQHAIGRMDAATTNGSGWRLPGHAMAQLWYNAWKDRRMSSEGCQQKSGRRARPAWQRETVPSRLGKFMDAFV